MNTRRNVDYSTRDYEGFRKDLIELLKIKIPEYTDFSQSDAGIVLIELLAHGLDILSFYNDIVANEVYLQTARERENVVSIARTLGYRVRNATASRFRQVFEIEPQINPYTIPRGFKVRTKAGTTEPSIIFETAQDFTIPAGKTGLETDELGHYIYTVPVVHGETIRDEVLGTSRGTPDQIFKFGYKPVIEDSIRVSVNEGAGFVRWNPVESFLSSDIELRDYVISFNEQDEAFVQFGNNLSGKIPAPYNNGIIATYRVGGGTSGNVAPNTIIEMPSKLAVIKATFNPDEAEVKALDRESIESIKSGAPRSLRTLERAVTLKDFEDIALLEGKARRASAIKNSVSEKVDICILPQYEETLSPEDIAFYNEFYSSRALIGIEYDILDPTYRPINLSVRIRTYPDLVNSEVEQIVRDVFEEHFAVGNLDFAEDIIFSDITTKLGALNEVRSVAIYDPLEDIEDTTKYEIPVLGTLIIDVAGGIEPEEVV